jgi:argininosuccinate synthase
MRNLDIADSRAKLEQYAGLGMFGGGHAALIGAGPDAATPGELIGAMPLGGAEAIASAGRGGAGQSRDGELLDRAAMEAGTD